MKYIITESKMIDVFSKYIEKSHPELLSLTRNRKETDDGYYINYYDELGNHYSIFSYLSEEEDGDKDSAIKTITTASALILLKILIF